MKAHKTLGIWMDHSTADLIDSHEGIQNQIQSEFTFDIKEETIKKGEKRMHNKENQLHEAYYKDLGDVIMNYDHVLLFGPTNAKTELHNYLTKDSHFKDIKMDVEAADKMTDNEKVAFVKDHFTKNLS